jgi:mannose-6-phosphate isomerase-like protein (cupin superfamily)
LTNHAAARGQEERWLETVLWNVPISGNEPHPIAKEQILMEAEPIPNPFLSFGPPQNREYGFIRLFDETAEAFGTLPFRYSRFTVAPGRTSNLDQHEVLEVWGVLSGRGKLTYEGSESQISAGDVVHFRSKKVHQVRNDGSDDLSIFSFWWKNE